MQEETEGTEEKALVTTVSLGDIVANSVTMDEWEKMTNTNYYRDVVRVQKAQFLGRLYKLMIEHFFQKGSFTSPLEIKHVTTVEQLWARNHIEGLNKEYLDDGEWACALGGVSSSKDGDYKIITISFIVKQ